MPRRAPGTTLCDRACIKYPALGRVQVFCFTFFFLSLTLAVFCSALRLCLPCPRAPGVRRTLRPSLMMPGLPRGRSPFAPGPMFNVMSLPPSRGRGRTWEGDGMKQARAMWKKGRA